MLLGLLEFLGFIRRCKKCKADLVDGPLITKEGYNKDMHVKVENIPTKICSKGCERYYWFDDNFGEYLLHSFYSDLASFSKRKQWLVKIKDYCRICGTELVDNHKIGEFNFVKSSNAYGNIKMTFRCHCLTCVKCNKDFIPGRLGGQTYDEFSGRISDTFIELFKNGFER